MSLLVIDARTLQPLDVIDNRQQRYLADYFTRYSLKARRNVKTVTMDMYSPYIQVIKDGFLNVEMIIDRFHIVQFLNRAFNQIHIKK